MTGVVAVESHHLGSKESQGNGVDKDHWQPTNWEVFVNGYTRTIEFEVTKHDHVKGATTRTVMFKDPRTGMRQLAWQILLKADGHPCVV